MSRFQSAFADRQRYWIAAFMLLGCLLRLVWAEDMKWKADEVWMYTNATNVVLGSQPWPWLGMGNGVGFLNPGLSIWCFIALRWLSSGPIEVVRWIQISNIVAIALFAGFIRRYIPRSEQNIWLWGLAIASVNPLAVHFSRAIWSVDILPFVGFWLFAGHWWRQTRWGALLWGLIGTLIGQIHMSGFFWQGSLFLWEVMRRKKQVTRWRWWLGGTMLGIIPMLPWIIQIATQAVTSTRPSWAEILTPNFHLHWLLTGWGLNLEYEFGSVLWRSLIFAPRLNGVPTFGIAILLIFLAISAIIAVIQGLNNLRHRSGQDKLAETSLNGYFGAGAVIMPLLLLLVRVRIPAHYLIILFPFTYTWVAWMLRRHQNWLIAVCWAQFCLTAVFLTYVHIHGGIPNGNYGISYAQAILSGTTSP